MKDNEIVNVNKKIQKLNEQGITLIALVVTIIILLILVGVTLTFALGENGIIGVAKKARKDQVIAETKEAIGLEITEAYTEATLRREELEKKQVEDIVNKYGKLQEDGDTIITKKDGYEISLKEIYRGVLSESGSYGAKVEQIEMLEKRVAELEDENNKLSSAGTLENYKITLFCDCWDSSAGRWDTGSRVHSYFLINFSGRIKSVSTFGDLYYNSITVRIGNSSPSSAELEIPNSYTIGSTVSPGTYIEVMGKRLRDNGRWRNGWSKYRIRRC